MIGSPRLQFHHQLYEPREDLITRNLRMRNHENENHIVNCGYYNKLWGYQSNKHHGRYTKLLIKTIKLDTPCNQVKPKSCRPHGQLMVTNSIVQKF